MKKIVRYCFGNKDGDTSFLLRLNLIVAIIMIVLRMRIL